MRATFQRGLWGRDRRRLDIEDDAVLSITQKHEPVADSEHRYLLEWSNAVYRQSDSGAYQQGIQVGRVEDFDAPGALLVRIYLTDAEYRQMKAVVDAQGAKKEEP